MRQRREGGGREGGGVMGGFKGGVHRCDQPLVFLLPDVSLLLTCWLPVSAAALLSWPGCLAAGPLGCRTGGDRALWPTPPAWRSL